MKSFFQRNKSHDPPPPAPSAKHHRSASAQPELRRTARAPSVRGVPASQPLHRTDRPDSPSRERQHADKLRSSSRAPRPPPEQPTTSSSYPERTAYTNGIAHSNGNAHLNGTYPGDSRSRAPKTYDAQSILERRREELELRGGDPPLLDRLKRGAGLASSLSLGELVDERAEVGVRRAEDGLKMEYVN